MRRVRGLRGVLASIGVIWLLCQSGIIPPSLASSPIQLVDSTTADSVNGSTYQPINRTQTFSASDQSVYSWVEFGNVPSPSHNVTWIWTSPKDTQYDETSVTIPDPGQGTTWATYYVWAFIYVAGYQAAQLQGTWKVDIYIDGVYDTYQLFTIAASAVPIQPVEGFSWPSTTIPVYVGPSPSNVRNDVEKAMLQWSSSQAWFQESYGLQSRPIFNLVLSSDPSSPAKVTFNQTQSSSNWGWTKYNYYYDANGNFISVSCSTSLVLTLSDGTPLNDVAMQDIAEHELGHCLGLWHTVQSVDLMNHFSGSFTTLRYPSTLNLYALYQLSAAHQVSQVPTYYNLPGSIGYSISPGYYGSNMTVSSTTSSTSSAFTTIVSSASSESQTTSTSTSSSSVVTTATSLTTTRTSSSVATTTVSSTSPVTTTISSSTSTTSELTTSPTTTITTSPTTTTMTLTVLTTSTATMTLTVPTTITGPTSTTTTTSLVTNTNSVVPTWAYGIMAVLLIAGLAIGYVIRRESPTPQYGYQGTFAVDAETGELVSGWADALYPSMQFESVTGSLNYSSASNLTVSQESFQIDGGIVGSSGSLPVTVPNVVVVKPGSTASIELNF